MQKRTLGKSGIEVAPLAFGGNVFGWTLDESRSFTLLDAFAEAGFGFIDTADVYTKFVPGHLGGESETIIGKWLASRGNRERVIIATKVGMPMAAGREGLSRAHIMRSAEESLRRLQTDYIDLYQSHTDDARTPLEETLGAYQALLAQGKIRAIGASNYAGARLQQALEVSSRDDLPPYESLQPLYNLYDREPFESDQGPVCARHGVGVIPYFSLASGFLTGKYRSPKDLEGSARGAGVQKYLTPRGQAILRALDEVAKAHHTKPAAVALAWLLSRPAVTAPIASATSTEQLKTLTDAVTLKLDAASLELLDRASGRAGDGAPRL